MTDSWPNILGGGAAILQVIAYIVYIRYFLNASIRPNAASWFMFSYGTALLVFLEWKNGAGMALLALPVTCAAMSIVVAMLCLRKDATDPVDGVEKFAFATDLWLTVAYVVLSTWWAASASFPVAMLVLGNMTTVVAFLPILRSTWLAPERETAVPWFLWAGAYGTLLAATLATDWRHDPELVIYPAISLLLHGAIALFSLRKQADSRVYVDDAKTIYISDSGIEGRGMFAAQPIGTGFTICQLRGTPVHGPVVSDVGPNWIGIGQDMWIDPDLPLDHINHSCNSNAAIGRNYELVALRPIHAGEEITMDYSTTEADPHWQMECHCGATDCRRVLYAIQISFADSPFPPPASPSMQNVWRTQRRQGLNRPAFPQLARAPEVDPVKTGRD